jgi:hypothetical protein
MAADAPDSVPLAWHHVMLRVPRTWEVVAYRNDPANASLVLADRHGETMHLYARPFSPMPDVGRRLRDLAESLPHGAAAWRRGQLEKRHGWDALDPDDASLPVFAGRFSPESGALVLLVFPPHPDRSDAALLDRVLASFRPNAGPERAWALYGLEVRLPADLELREVSPMPAAQALTFETRRGDRVTVHRYGMMPRILGDGDMASFYARVAGRRRLLRRAGEFRKDGRYEGVHLSYSSRGRGGLDSLLSPVWLGRVWVWRRDDLLRLYAVDQHGPERAHLPDLLERVHGE